MSWLMLCCLLLLQAAAVRGDAVPEAPVSWVSLDEVDNFISQLRNVAPEIVHEPITIGESYEGRPLRVFCVGACADSSAPGLLVTAMHHGREALGMLAGLHLLRVLVAAYQAEDPIGVALARRRQFWVIPSVNPDAYAYNLAHAVQGRRMARKNRRPGCSMGTQQYDAVGVDLNRNYDFAWDIDNEGSNPAPCAEDYRGASAFSEPESRAVRDFVKAHPSLSVALNWHSYGRLINVPYAVQRIPAPPDAVYSALLSVAQGMARETGFSYGHPWTGGLYTVNGEASDWMVKEAGILAFSPELGPVFDAPFEQGMWPSAGEIPALVQEALSMSAYAAWTAGAVLGLHGAGATPGQAGLMPGAVVGAAALSVAACAGAQSTAQCAELIAEVEFSNRGHRGSVGTVVVQAIPVGAAHDVPVCLPQAADANGQPGTQPICVSSVLTALASAEGPGWASTRYPVSSPLPAPPTSSGGGAARALRAHSGVHAVSGLHMRPLIDEDALAAVKAVVASGEAATVPVRRAAETEAVEGQERITRRIKLEGILEAHQQGRQLPATMQDLPPQLIPALNGSVWVLPPPDANIAAAQPFSKTGFKIRMPLPQPSCADSASREGVVAYLAVSDEQTCVVYNLECSGQLTVRARGPSEGAGCAAFRLALTAEAPQPQPSPSRAPTPTAAPSPAASHTAAATHTAAAASASPSSAAAASASPSPSPAGPRADDVGGADGGEASGGMWPWGASTVSPTTQVLVLVVGVVVGVVGSVTVLRRRRLLGASTGQQRVVIVRQPGEIRSSSVGASAPDAPDADYDSDSDFDVYPEDLAAVQAAVASPGAPAAAEGHTDSDDDDDDDLSLEFDIDGSEVENRRLTHTRPAVQ